MLDSLYLAWKSCSIKGDKVVKVKHVGITFKLLSWL